MTNSKIFDILSRFKFWVFDLFRKDFIKMWVYDQGRVLEIHNENLDRTGAVEILGQFYNIDISKTLKQKNHYVLVYSLENSSAVRFTGDSEIIDEYTNKNLSNLIDRKTIKTLFDLSFSLENIVMMALSGGCLAGVLYLILVQSGMGL